MGLRQWMILGAIAAPMLTTATAQAQAGAPTEIQASAPRALSVTLYRNPERSSGSIRLSALGGFALVTETREVRLPMGESRLRFEGVVEGIQADSAIISGLPHGVIEKNRDAALVSPEALVKASLEGDVTLIRRRGGRSGDMQMTTATIRSADSNGIVLQTEEGVEALKCSGLAETLDYDRLPPGLSTVPTLSVLTRSDRAVTTTVTLSYLSSGFDWAANYVARAAPDGRTLDLSGWVTLANSNGVALPEASVQVVAGRLNRSPPAKEATPPSRLVARCWPAGTTSDPADAPILVMAEPRHKESMVLVAALRALPAPATPPPPPEDLGDLKLYRLGRAVTIAARQSKQIHFLDQSHVAFTRILSADLPMRGDTQSQPAAILLRAKNARSDNLGIPLPAGRVAVFRPGPATELLVGDAPVDDTAVDALLELPLGRAPSVTIAQSRSPGGTRQTVLISNAGAQPETFELRLRPGGLFHLVGADQPMAMKNGRPIFRLQLPANGVITLHYDVVPG